MPIDTPAALRLPDYSGRLRLRATSAHTAEIYDPLRRLWLCLTPEEWVRQNMVLYLSERLQIPLTRFRNEVALQVNGLARRCDTVIYSRDGRPCIIAEYKRPDVPVTQQVFNQAAVYCDALGVDCIVVSNGISHYMCHIDRAAKRYIFTHKLDYNG